MTAHTCSIYIYIYGHEVAIHISLSMGASGCLWVLLGVCGNPSTSNNPKNIIENREKDIKTKEMLRKTLIYAQKR